MSFGLHRAVGYQEILDWTLLSDPTWSWLYSQYIRLILPYIPSRYGLSIRKPNSGPTLGSNPKPLDGYLDLQNAQHNAPVSQNRVYGLLGTLETWPSTGLLEDPGVLRHGTAQKVAGTCAQRVNVCTWYILWPSRCSYVLTFKPMHYYMGTWTPCAGDGALDGQAA